MFLVRLECHSYHDAYAVFVGCRQIGVGHASYVFHMQQLEDVMNTDNHFPVRTFRIHYVTAVRECHKNIVIAV